MCTAFSKFKHIVLMHLRQYPLNYKHFLPPQVGFLLCVFFLAFSSLIIPPNFKNKYNRLKNNTPWRLLVSVQTHNYSNSLELGHKFFKEILYHHRNSSYIDVLRWSELWKVVPSLTSRGPTSPNSFHSK